MRTRMGTAVLLAALAAFATTPAGAIHFYRNSGGGCTAADGALSDDAGPSGPVAAEVMLLHNTYADATTALPVTRIEAGQAVRWTWNSSHCHSVTGPGISSGFHWPAATPESPRVVPNFFDYPVLDDTPTLSFTHTFDTPGEYTYFCVHHATIGMQGVVIVE